MNMIDDLSVYGQRIAQLDAAGGLYATHVRMLTLAHNDLSDDIDALQAKIAKFGAMIDRVEHDGARERLAAEASARFDRIVQDIREAADGTVLDQGRKIIQTLDVWKTGE